MHARPGVMFEFSPPLYVWLPVQTVGVLYGLPPLRCACIPLRRVEACILAPFGIFASTQACSVAISAESRRAGFGGNRRCFLHRSSDFTRASRRVLEGFARSS